MGAMPELGTPAHETHIVRATAVLSDVRYGATASELVSYEASDPRSLEKIRVQSDAVAAGVAVLLDGERLERVGELRGLEAVEGGARGAWALDAATGVLEVARIAGGRVAIVRA